MPNWCFTDYTLVGSAEDAKAAYDALHNLEQTDRPGPFAPWSFQSKRNWLGYVVEDILKRHWSEIPCRGTFANLELSQWDGRSAVILSTETAWSPCEDLMAQFAAKFRLSLNFYSEEPGNNYYCKENPDGIFTQVLCYSNDEGIEYYDSLAAFIKTRGEQYKLKPDASLSEALDVVNASEGGWLAEITDQT